MTVYSLLVINKTKLEDFSVYTLKFVILIN